jgi:hypothetical protein
VSRDEALAAMAGQYFYSDLPATTDSFQNERVYRATRIDPKAIRRVVNRYGDLIGEPESDQTTRIARSLGASANRYFSLSQAGAIDPATFREYLQTSIGEGESLSYIQQLEGLLADMKSLGLDGIEYRQARAKLLADIVPKERMTVEQFARVIERGKPGA